MEHADRAAYLKPLSRALHPGGHATFAPDGPEICSGLPVVRYSLETLADVIGPDYKLTAQRHQKHLTPSGVAQSFQFSLFRKLR